MTTKERSIIKLFGLLTLLFSLPFFFVGQFEDPVLMGFGLTLFCLSNGLFRIALEKEFQLTDSVVSTLVNMHKEELNKFIEEWKKSKEKRG